MGVRSIAIGLAVSELEGRRRKLEASDDPGLQPIAGNLVELERPLAADEPVAATTGRLLTELGDRTEAVVSETATLYATLYSRQTTAAEPVAHRRGRSATYEAQRSTTQGRLRGARVCSGLPGTKYESFVILLAREAGQRGAIMDVEQLERTAEELVPPSKGLLAADESFGTIGKRFEAVGIEADEETRRQYRELLFTTEGIGEYLSGVILFDETIRQNTSNGKSLVEVLQEQGIIPGIKVDRSTVDLPLAPGEKYTQGLDGLGERLEEYVEMGARFTKWRAVITIGDGIPTVKCVESNARALALYAAFSQEAGLVPIVEPEVLIDGDHSIERSFEVNEWTLRRTYEAMYEQGVHLEGTLLKPNFVINGKDASEKASVEDVARYTIECFKRSVPAAVPGIVLLSGGQSGEDATAHLNAMKSMYDDLPWEISFSWARALQGRPMEIWGGDEQNVAEAQKVFQHRARMASVAATGNYSRDMEQEQAA